MKHYQSIANGINNRYKSVMSEAIMKKLIKVAK